MQHLSFIIGYVPAHCPYDSLIIHSGKTAGRANLLCHVLEHIMCECAHFRCGEFRFAVRLCLQAVLPEISTAAGIKLLSS